ncbi:MAG: hypothetical protein HY288_06790 [Planctomycetia bacterium]|nr:hypothetical protein [Planctomycetia bacterium]
MHVFVKPAWVVALFCSASVITASTTSANDAALRARFLDEAPKAWSKIIELSKHADVEVIDRRHYFEEQEEMEVSSKSRISGDNFLSEAKSIKVEPPRDSFNAGQEQVECVNSKYGFAIRKTRPDGPWQIQSLSNDLEDIKGWLLRKVGVTVNPLFAVYVRDKFLPDWIRDPGFKVTGVESAHRASGELVVVHFETDRPPAAKKDQKPISHWMRSGDLFLNPERLWAIEEYQIQAVWLPKEQAQTYTRKSEFGPSAEGYPIMRRSKDTGAWGTTKQPKFARDWDFTRFEIHNIPESEFRLPAFGLPELGPPSLFVQGRLWMALVGLGILCIVIAILIRQRASAA